MDLLHGTVSVSRRRVEKAKHQVLALLAGECSVLNRQVFVGSVISMHLILSDAVFRTRASQSVVAQCQRENRDSQQLIKPSEAELEEWNHWLTRLEDPPNRSLLPSFSESEFLLFTDASSEALGAVLIAPNFEKRSSRNLDIATRDMSSTLRELKGVEFGLEAFAQFIPVGSQVRVFCDNQAAVAILKKGSLKKLLHETARSVAMLGEQKQLRLFFAWVPREFNEPADEMSRMVDRSDWGISPTIASIVQKRLGWANVDLFANEVNSKCARFMSRFPTPGSLGSDAFSCPSIWRPPNVLWCVPPTTLICKTLGYARMLGSRGILGIPRWSSHAAWPLIAEKTGKYKSFIRDSVEFGTGARILIPSSSGNSLFESEFLKFAFVFLKFDFSQRALENSAQ